MDAAGLGVDLRLERVGIGALQLGELAPFQDLAHDLRRLAAVAGQAFEFGHVGRVHARLALAPAFQAEPVEQDLTQLLGAADGEGGARHGMDFALQCGDLSGEFGRELRQALAIDLDPAPLHARDDGDERPVDHLVHPRRLLHRQPRLEPLPQPQRDVGILGGVAGRGLEVDFVEAELLLAGADHLLESEAGVRQMRRGQLVHAVAMEPGVEIEAQDDGVVMRCDGDPALAQHDHVELQVLADLQDRRVLAQCFDPLERLGDRNLHRRLGQQIGAAMAQRDVARLVGREAQADPDQFCLGRVGRAGLGIDRDEALVTRLRDPLVERLQVLHGGVAVEIARLVIVHRGGGRGLSGVRSGGVVVGDLAHLGDQ